VEVFATPWAFAAAALICLLGGMLKGSIGFGFPLMAVPAMALFLGPKAAVLLVAVPVLVTNTQVVVRKPLEPALMRRLLPAIVMTVLGTIVGALLLGVVDPRFVGLLIGVSSITFSLLAVFKVNPSIGPAFELPAALLAGGVGGFLSGATGIFGPVMAIYLTALRFEKWPFVYGLTLLFVTGNVVQVLSYVQQGLYSWGLILASALLIPAALLGQWLGFKIQDRLDPVAFRRVVVVVVALSGLNLIWRSLAA
jgi:uncharacterized membrane protein YfcA